MPQGGCDETRSVRPIIEVGPRRGREYSPAVTFPQRRELPLNLVRCQKIIRIQLLDVVTLAEPVGIVYRPGKALIRCGHDFDAFRSKLPRHLSRPIRGPIVHYDDLLALPGLGSRGLERIDDPIFGVISGDQNRDQWFHSEVPGRSELGSEVAPCCSFRLIISSIRSTKSNLLSENFRANSISPAPQD